MLPTSFTGFLTNMSARLKFPSSALLILNMILLSSCDPGKVPPSFGYALGGTFAVMLAGLVIATFVTSRNKKKGGEK
jgi:hypothetical protein